MDMTYEAAYDTAYYAHGTPAERWERAQLFFDARDYAAAARVLAGLVEEVPEQTGPRLLLARAAARRRWRLAEKEGAALIAGGVVLAGLAGYTAINSYAFNFSPTMKREMGLGIASNMPVSAVDYIARNRIGGRRGNGVPPRRSQRCDGVAGLQIRALVSSGPRLSAFRRAHDIGTRRPHKSGVCPFSADCAVRSRCVSR